MHIYKVIYDSIPILFPGFENCSPKFSENVKEKEKKILKRKIV